MEVRQEPHVMFNIEMARRFRFAAHILRAQNADPHRYTAYERGACELEHLEESAAVIYRRDGLDALVVLPGIGAVMAAAIADVAEHGHWRWLDRLAEDFDPEPDLAAIPKVGTALAHRLHTELHIESLDDLERAVYDGRLGRMRGMGDKRWHAIRDAVVAHRRTQGSTR